MSNRHLYDELYRGRMSQRCECIYGSNVEEQLFESFLDRQTLAGKRVLELGCGVGHLSQWLQSKGYDVLATDFSEVALSIARSRYPTVKFESIDAENISLPSDSFDVVIGIELIEHLCRPRRHLEEVRRVLVKGGVYIIKTPNKWLDKFYYSVLVRKNVSKEHVSLCTPGQLRRMLIESGFVPRFLRHDGLFPTQERKVRALLPARAAGATVAILDWSLRALPLLLCPSIICIGKKQR